MRNPYTLFLVAIIFCFFAEVFCFTMAYRNGEFSSGQSYAIVVFDNKLGVE